MALFQNTPFKLMEQGMDAVWYKQKVISHNISNSDTPNYKTKNVDFGLVLAEEQCKCAYHSANQEKEAKRPVSLRVVTSTEPDTNFTLDENNVNVETEAMKLVDAQYQYSALIDHVNNEFAMISAALQK